MKQFMNVMRKAWQTDLFERQSLTRSGNFWLFGAALFLPFGWVFLLLRLEPVRLFVRSLRD